jgi:hypothetical protein
MEEMLISRPFNGNSLSPFFHKEGESIQLDCQKKLKEELKFLWARAVLSEFHLLDQPSFKARALRALKSPFVRASPILEVLSHLLAKQLGRLTAPLIPRHKQMPLFELCQLALLWSIAGFSKEASSLAASISSFVDFPTLWCREEEYDEKESHLSLALFRGIPSSALNSDTPPFFLALAQVFSGFDVPCSIEPFSPEPLFLYSSDIQGTLSSWGKGTSLGILRSKDVEVRSFGPQSLPLNNPQGFGIERALEGSDGWVNASGLPEVWLHVKNFFEEGLEVRFLGVPREPLLTFSFYVKAASAQIGASRFMPKSLIRYQGEAKPVLFGDKFQIESLLPTKMELIPLAGEGCFWGTEFLLSFEIHPLESRCLFRWGVLK